MMEYQQLMISDSLSEKEREFKQLHIEIVSKGAMAAECLLDMCVSIKKMRDKELYKLAGFNAFEDYTEKALNIKRRQAYIYISVVENLSPAFVQSNAQLGVTKLALLATLADEERNEVLENTDIEDVSVKELKELIDQQNKKIEQMTMQFDRARADREAVVTASAEILTESKERGSEIDRLEAELSLLKSEAKTVETVTIKDPEMERILAKANEELACRREEMFKKEEKEKKLKAEIEALKNAPVQKEIVIDPEMEKALAVAKAKIEEIELSTKAKEEEIAKLTKSVEVAKDILHNKFKIKVEDFQQQYNEIVGLISQMTAEKQEKCKRGLSKLIGGWSV